MIGSFGKLTFEVSADKVKTFSGLSREHKATFASHEIINGAPLLQHTGRELQSVSFSMTFRADLGVNPQEELDSLKKMITEAEPQKLFIGDVLMGQFVIENISETYNNIDRAGKIYAASVSITLKEYIK